MKHIELEFLFVQQVTLRVRSRPADLHLERHRSAVGLAAKTNGNITTDERDAVWWIPKLMLGIALQ